MEKRGVLTEDSRSDFDGKKKVRYVEAEGYKVAGEGEQHLLTNPVALSSPSNPPGYKWPVLK